MTKSHHRHWTNEGESTIGIRKRKKMGFKRRGKDEERWSSGDDVRWKTVPQTSGCNRKHTCFYHHILASRSFYHHSLASRSLSVTQATPVMMWDGRLFHRRVDAIGNTRVSTTTSWPHVACQWRRLLQWCNECHSTILQHNVLILVLSKSSSILRIYHAVMKFC